MNGLVDWWIGRLACVFKMKRSAPVLGRSSFQTGKSLKSLKTAQAQVRSGGWGHAALHNLKIRLAVGFAIRTRVISAVLQFARENSSPTAIHLKKVAAWLLQHVEEELGERSV